jgi:hypothetical protein
MRKLMLLCAWLCAMAFVVPGGLAQAQTIAWVGPTGSDSNSCAETAPCATFAGAIEKGGIAQINCLGSGNYGALNSTTVSITGSIVIDCGAGNVGEMTTNGGNPAININTSAAASIVLRHLSLNGGGGNAYGISEQNFGSGTLIIENCAIYGFTGGAAIYFVSSSGRGMLQVSDSQLSGNGYGIYIYPTSGQITSVVLNRDELFGNGDGLVFDGPGVVAGTMRQTLVDANSNNGVVAGSGQVFFTIEESSIMNNLRYGIEVDSSGTLVNVGASTIGGNGTGVISFGGSIISFGNNQMSANGTNGAFTSTAVLQ